MTPQGAQELPAGVTRGTSAPPQDTQSWKEWSEARKRQLTEWRLTTVAADRDEWYTPLMSELGVDSATIDRFKAELKDLHRKATVAGDPLLELAVARSAYDEKIRLALGDQHYERYRTYESHLPAIREYESLQEYALAQHSLDLDPAYASKIVDLMYAAGATTTETWDGPYDPLPRPAAGTSQVLQRTTADYSALRNSSAALMNAAAEADIPEDYRKVLQEYYRIKLEQLSSSLADLQKSPGQIHEEAAADANRLIEQMASHGEIKWNDGSRH